MFSFFRKSTSPSHEKPAPESASSSLSPLHSPNEEVHSFTRHCAQEGEVLFHLLDQQLTCSSLPERFVTSTIISAGSTALAQGLFFEGAQLSLGSSIAIVAGIPVIESFCCLNNNYRLRVLIESLLEDTLLVQDFRMARSLSPDDSSTFEQYLTPEEEKEFINSLWKRGHEFLDSIIVGKNGKRLIIPKEVDDETPSYTFEQLTEFLEDIKNFHEKRAERLSRVSASMETSSRGEFEQLSSNAYHQVIRARYIQEALQKVEEGALAIQGVLDETTQLVTYIKNMIYHSLKEKK